jgi:hypothetical protein
MLRAGGAESSEEAGSNTHKGSQSKDTLTEVRQSKKKPVVLEQQVPPKITPPSVDMYKDLDGKLNEQTNFNKK